MLVHRRVTRADRGTVRVKCLAEEHNTMSPARARTRTARSGVERTNFDEATVRAVSDREIISYHLMYGVE